MNRWLLLLFAWGICGGCRRHDGPPLNVSGAPTGAVTGARPVVQVVFEHPIVAPELVGQPLDKPVMTIRPPVAGRFTWVDTRTLTFTPDAALPRATEFAVEVAAGVRAQGGTVLKEPYRFTFQTPRPTARLELLNAAPVDPVRWATPLQPVRITLSQTARAEEVRDACAYLSDGKKVDARLNEAAEATSFVAVPDAPLPPATPWTFKCDERLVGREGPLGLAKPATVEFRTYGPLQVAKVQPFGTEVDIDSVIITLELSTPPAEGALPLSIEPALDGFPERVSRDGSTLRFHASHLQPETAYTIKLAGELRDVFGQALGQPHTATFRTGNASPRLDLETGVWVVESSRPALTVWQRNLTAIDLQVGSVSDARLPDLLSKLNWWDDASVDLAALKLPYSSKKLPVQGRLNHWEQLPLDPKALTGTSPPGIFYFAASAPETIKTTRVREALVNFTNLGLSTKFAAGAGLVWVTRLDSGQPVDGAEVIIRDRKGKVRWRGRTSSDGVATTPGMATLAPQTLSAGAGHDEFEGEMEEESSERARDLLIFARLGDDVTWVDPGRSGGFSAWNFNTSPDPDPQPVRLRGFLHSDRGLYRPGDTVHLRGLARTMRLGEGLRVPAAQKGVQLTIRDPRGDEVVKRTAALSRFGGFTIDVPLPADARLGDWSVQATLPQGQFQETFSVEEYRPAAFEVKARSDRPFVVAGGRLRVDAEAKYLYGSPLRAGRITWRVHSRPRTLNVSSFPGFDFDDETRWDSWYERSRDSEEFVAEEEQTLDAEGRARLALKLDGKAMSESRDYLVTAEVHDETNQRIAAHLAVPVHRSAIYFGVQAEHLVQAGKPMRAKVAAVDPTGKAIAGQARVRLVRRSWPCVWEAWGYHGSYRCEKKEADVASQQVTVAAAAPSEVTFTPPSPGDYLLVVDGKDAQGRPTQAARFVWAWGEGEPPWRADGSTRFDIVPDKTTYRPGDTARLLLKAPFKDAQALVTVEREGVLERKLVAVTSASQTLEIPLRDLHAPNVYVSVLLARGRSGSGSRGLPMMRMGMVNLSVAPDDRRLQVQVATERESYRPGEKVTATISVTDAAGKPVRAEVALAVADEGVLSLIGYKTPDPLPTFYAPWGLGVQTATQYERLLRLPEPGEERYATGGDGNGRPGTMRSRFMATAYWNPRLETDAGGKTTVSFQAPDNLTAFRVMATVTDEGDRFGAGDRRFTVRKPLQLMAAFPRFLNVSDQPVGGVVLINETGKAGSVTVEAKVDGVALTGPARQQVNVPAGGRARLSFPLRADRAGEARLRFFATLGNEKDAFEIKLPVQYPAPGEVRLIGQGETRDQQVVAVTLPPGALPDGAMVDISVDPDGLAGIEQGLRALIEYPYGCLEQTTSRLIPLLAVEELSRTLQLEGLEGPRLKTFITAGVQKLGKFQTEEGGFTLWMGGREPEPYLTAFALWGLHLAKKGGHEVDPRRIDAGVAYLRRTLNQNVPPGVHNELGELGARAFALHVLAMLGSPDAAAATKLLERKAALPRFGVAFLTRALGVALGPTDPAVRGLVSDLVGNIEVKGTSALVREAPNPALSWYMSDDTRTTAIVTDTLMDLAPTQPQVAQLVRGLMGERRHGSWMTTQSNLYALVALTRWARARTGTPVSTSVKIGERAVISGPLAGAGLRVRKVSVPFADVQRAGGKVSVAAQGGAVHYSVLARFRRDLPSQTAFAAPGLELSRRYLDPVTDKPIDTVKAGQTVRVRLTVSSPQPLHHVALVDRLPAGLEPINTRLRTSAAAGPHDESDEEETFSLSHRELRDDRVELFMDRVYGGATTLEYLARATTPGKFVVPAATVEEMYQPANNARLGLSTLEVQP